MLKVLEQIRSGHIGLAFVFLVFLVFIATPILKHLLFKRSRGGSVYLPHAKPEWTAGQMREAREFLHDKKRREAEAKRADKD
jgi:hypothetical protein